MSLQKDIDPNMKVMRDFFAENLQSEFVQASSPLTIEVKKIDAAKLKAVVTRDSATQEYDITIRNPRVLQSLPQMASLASFVTAAEVQIKPLDGGAPAEFNIINSFGFGGASTSVYADGGKKAALRMIKGAGL
jgi:hypothetical protein